MAPVPRPPIICYDLQTNENLRRPVCTIHRAPLTTTAGSNRTRKTKPVTVIQKDPNELRKILKEEAKEHERRAEHKRRQLAQLDEVNAQLESAKRIQENLLKTFGMSHTTAKYIQKQDDDNAALRRKIDQFSRTRSKEISQRDQQMRRLHELQQIADKKAEEKRLRDLSKFTNRCERTADTTRSRRNTSNSTSTSTSTNININTNSTIATKANATSTSEGSSSTISISSSSCCSSTSIDEQLSSISSVDFAEPTPIKNKAIATSAKTTSMGANKEFSFYKGNSLDKSEVLEVSDEDFFEKVEDKTMMEVNELVKRLRLAVTE